MDQQATLVDTDAFANQFGPVPNTHYIGSGAAKLALLPAFAKAKLFSHVKANAGHVLLLAKQSNKPTDAIHFEPSYLKPYYFQHTQKPLAP
jgi:tRNA A37 threonylcarbamoyladenosine modification protein TsaB